MTTAPTTTGRPLEAGIRDQLSASYGYDFSSVRIHTGKEADLAARSVGAKAYTVGSDVVFAQGAYDPLSGRGRALIAHELAHVAQHRGARLGPNLYLEAGRSYPPASERLERQADLAASRWQVPLPSSWVWERSHAPFVGRAAGIDWQPPPAPYTVRYAGEDRVIDQENRDRPEAEVLRVNMREFILPPEKGPWVDRYREIAASGGLQASVAVGGKRARAELWQKRADSEELRRLWLRRVGWPAKSAAQWWHEAGGDGSSSFNPRVQRGVPAQIDHIVELQLGGTNVPENLAPHNGPDNEESGRSIWNSIREAATGVKAAVSERPDLQQVKVVILHFTGAKQKEGYRLPTAALPTLPLEPNAREAAITARKGQAQSALQVHFTAVADNSAGARPSAAEREAAAAGRGPLNPFPVIAGPSTATLQLPERGPKPDPIEGSDVPENHAARELISGVTLEHIARKAKSAAIVGWIGSSEHPPRSGTRLPMEVPNPDDQKLDFVVGDGGSLELKGGAERIRFLYPYLSTGNLRLTMTGRGLEGHGTLTPSVPLLRRVPIEVHFAENRLEGTITAPAEKLQLKPFKVTSATLGLSLAPTLSAQGKVGFELGSLVSGEIEAGVDAEGFYADGRVQAHIPRLDQAEGRISYRPSTGVTGFAVARASSAGGIVRSGEVRVDFAGEDWTVSGQVKLMLPGDSPAELTARKRNDAVEYTGAATLNVPGLRPVDVRLTYDGERVRGRASTNFTVLGARGDMELRYDDGRFSGKGKVELERDRFRGELHAELDDEGRISGKGEGAVTIRPGLVGTVGIELSRDRRLRLAGELRFPPYRFLEPRAERRRLFERTLPPIPIFAIPLGIGSVGLVATVGGGLAVRYSFGPGELRDMVIRGTMNPLEEDPNLAVEASARLVIPAEAGLELSLRAGIGASVVIATATGGITVTGGVLLRGGLDAAANLKYAGGILTFDAEAGISVTPVLTLGITADLRIEADLGGPWSWPYQLAAYSFDTGLTFGMLAPFHYASNEPFRPPSVDDIRWIVPDIDVSALAERIAQQVRRGIDV